MQLETHMAEAAMTNSHVLGYEMHTHTSGTLRFIQGGAMHVVYAVNEGVLGRVYWQVIGTNTPAFDTGSFEVTSSMVLAEELDRLVNHFAPEATHV